MNSFRVAWLYFWIRTHTLAKEYFEEKRDHNAKELRILMGELYTEKYGGTNE